MFRLTGGIVESGIKFSMAFICATGVIPSVQAESASLEALMKQALDKNPEIAAAQSARDEAYYEVRRSLWALFPSFRASSSQSEAQIDQTLHHLFNPCGRVEIYRDALHVPNRS